MSEELLLSQDQGEEGEEGMKRERKAERKQPTNQEGVGKKRHLVSLLELNDVRKDTQKRRKRHAKLLQRSVVHLHQLL